ncbi:MAG: poly-gamma-glutamate system protein [Verrucomicrobia bacterium]|nr:poly-gamma-glutamate system protein [Verrucomicrobiota bacterium]
MARQLESRGWWVLALGAVGIWIAVDRARWLGDDPAQAVRVEAARTMARGIEVLREERIRRAGPIDARNDPNRTALIGKAYTDLTTTLGDLEAKRTSTNPNLAGLVAELLQQAGARPGDPVAVACSGSFPALNLAVFAAVQALELQPTIISSVGASSFGANEPGWTWLDLEQVLAERGVLRHRSDWVALGGIVDEGGGLDGTGLLEGAAAIRRSGRPVLEEGGRKSLVADVRRRLELLGAGERRPRVFVNVGGGLTSLGGVSEGAMFPPGLIRRALAPPDPRDGVIARMLEAGIPVVHLLDLRRLARAHGLPWDPMPLPAVPSGTVMRPRGLGRWAAGVGLVALGALLLMASRCWQKRPRPEEIASIRIHG